MNDEQWKEEIRKIDNPIDMLQAIIDNLDYLGYDPYYADLRETLVSQAKIILNDLGIPQDGVVI